MIFSLLILSSRNFKVGIIQSITIFLAFEMQFLDGRLIAVSTLLDRCSFVTDVKFIRIKVA